MKSPERDNELILIIDFIVDFPEEGVLWIGLFMLNTSYKRKGIGMEILGAFFNVSKLTGYQHVQLGVYDDNFPAVAFWERNGFAEFRQTQINNDKGSTTNILVMKKEL